MRRKCEYDGCGNYAVCLDKNDKYACGIHAVTTQSEDDEVRCDECGLRVLKKNAHKLLPESGDCGAEYYVCQECE